MSLLNKVVSAMILGETDEERDMARGKAQSAASLGDWLSMVVEHHRYIESAFMIVATASTATARVRAQRQLGMLLIGHANAEETVLYPALAGAAEKAHANRAYAEQAVLKTQMALLEAMPPMSQAYLEKLEDIRRAVTHHMYEEERSWFLELKKKVPSADQIRLSQRYEQEFYRYMGDDTRPLRTPQAAFAELSD